jgi:hypothetical protein
MNQEIIDKLKRAYHQQWIPSDYKYMVLEPHTGAVIFSNDLDCDGSCYFNRRGFPRIIEKWQKSIAD